MKIKSDYKLIMVKYIINTHVILFFQTWAYLFLQCLRFPSFAVACLASSRHCRSSCCQTRDGRHDDETTSWSLCDHFLGCFRGPNRSICCCCCGCLPSRCWGSCWSWLECQFQGDQTSLQNCMLLLIILGLQILIEMLTDDNNNH